MEEKQQLTHPEEVTKAKPIEKEKTLLIWEGPERPFKARDRKYYSGMISIEVVLFLFLMFAGQYILVLVFLSVLFAAYSLYSIPPKKIPYVLTDVGVEIDGEKRPWSAFKGYFITKNLDQKIINLEISTKNLLNLVYLIPNNLQTLDEAQKIVEKYLPLKPITVDKSIVGKAFKRLSDYIKEPGQ